ncbi:MAG: ABC transporter ATP-binding protein [Waddliaceae bacterium]
MKNLFLAAFGNRKHWLLILFSVFAMCLLTLASQLEVLALGVITKSGPDFFELFASKKEGVLQKTDCISKKDLHTRWEEIATHDAGVITKEDAISFLSREHSSDRIQQVINLVDRFFAISGNRIHLVFLLVIVALFKAVTLFSHRFAIKVVAIRVSRDLRQQYFEHIQSLPMEFYQQYNIGTLASRVVEDAEIISEALSAVLVNYLQTPFTVVTTLAICFATSWELSLIVFCGLPAIFLPIAYISGKVRKIARQIQKNQESFTSVLIDFLSGIQTVKIFAMEEFSLKKYREQNQRMAHLEKKSARYDLSSRPIVHTIGMFCLSIALLWGLYILQLSVSEAFFFCGLLYVFYEPIKKFAEENSDIQRGITAAERMFEVLSMRPQLVDQKDAKTLGPFQGPIEFKNVSFRYGKEWVLRNFSFTVNRGETVAIVGPTGAGKSTIVQLLPRLYEVQEGDILIDGKSIRTYTQHSLRENIAFVPQKPFLFLDTVAANLSYGRTFLQEEIFEAARKARADEFIRQLPNGYNTTLSESGKNLSGGQQQRLAIARALLKNAPILIMDEATSSLDTVSEKSIRTAIRELKGGTTQIIIAHRLTTIEDADKIIYMEQGKKIAEGTKADLLVNCSGFRKMWEAMHESTG